MEGCRGLPWCSKDRRREYYVSLPLYGDGIRILGRPESRRALEGERLMLGTVNWNETIRLGYVSKLLNINDTSCRIPADSFLAMMSSISSCVALRCRCSSVGQEHVYPYRNFSRKQNVSADHSAIQTSVTRCFSAPILSHFRICYERGCRVHAILLGTL